MREEFVELFRIPFAVHIGFPEGDAAARGDPFQHTRGVDLQIPRPWAVDADISLSQQFLNEPAKNEGSPWGSEFRRCGSEGSHLFRGDDYFKHTLFDHFIKRPSGGYFTARIFSGSG
jgi:hypothetical protein